MREESYSASQGNPSPPSPRYMSVKGSDLEPKSTGWGSVAKPDPVKPFVPNIPAAAQQVEYVDSESKDASEPHISGRLRWRIACP